MLATKSNNLGRPLTAKGFQMNLNAEATNTHLDAFLAAAHHRKYPAKSTLIYAGDKSDSIYYILKGSVTVLVEDESGREIIVTYLNKGDFFGEMNLFTEETPRSAWVKAKIECEVAELFYNKFKELAERQPDLLYAVG
jgi:CRP/FNR family cyclic AMP-dependent transcriptional regulator